MVKGFLLGTVTLVALEVLLKSTYGIDNLQKGTNVFSRGLKRLLAADVAGIPNKAKSSETTAIKGDATGAPIVQPAVTNRYVA
jgi:hypothetical protein